MLEQLKSAYDATIGQLAQARLSGDDKTATKLRGDAEKLRLQVEVETAAQAEAERQEAEARQLVEQEATEAKGKKRLADLEKCQAERVKLAKKFDAGLAELERTIQRLAELEQVHGQLSGTGSGRSANVERLRWARAVYASAPTLGGRKCLDLPRQFGATFSSHKIQTLTRSIGGK